MQQERLVIWKGEQNDRDTGSGFSLFQERTQKQDDDVFLSSWKEYEAEGLKEVGKSSEKKGFTDETGKRNSQTSKRRERLREERVYCTETSVFSCFPSVCRWEVNSLAAERATDVIKVSVSHERTTTTKTRLSQPLLIEGSLSLSLFLSYLLTFAVS